MSWLRFSVLVVCLLIIMNAQPVWAVSLAKTYGGTKSDHAFAIGVTFATAAGIGAAGPHPAYAAGLVFAGLTYSFGNPLYGELWVVRLGSSGTILWQRSYDTLGSLGSGAVNGRSSIRQTPDGGFIVTGGSLRTSLSSNVGWALKLFPDGTVYWQRAYSGADRVSSIIQLVPSGDYVAAGYSAGSPGDFWVARLNPLGVVVWEYTYGGAISYDEAKSVTQVFPSGNIVVVGTSDLSMSGDDILVLEINPSTPATAFTPIWGALYGGPGGEEGYSVIQVPGGDLVVVGSTDPSGTGLSDAWVLRLSPGGIPVWEMAYGGSQNDIAVSAAWNPTCNNRVAVAGITTSAGAGFADGWLFEVGPAGVISTSFDRTYGGSGVDFNLDIEPIFSGYAVAGLVNPPLGGGIADALVLTTTCRGTIPGCTSSTMGAPIAPGVITSTPSNVFSPITVTTTSSGASSGGSPTFMAAGYPVTTSSPTAGSGPC